MLVVDDLIGSPSFVKKLFFLGTYTHICTRSPLYTPFPSSFIETKFTMKVLNFLIDGTPSKEDFKNSLTKKKK